MMDPRDAANWGGLMESDEIGELGTILGVWGHPDDEAYLSGGLMAAALANGQRVVCVTATRGEAGFDDLESTTTDERMQIRETELAACLEVLGVTDHRWLDYADGGCGQVIADEPVAILADVIAEVSPDTILTFGRDGMTGHVDHIAAGRWTTMAFEQAAPSGARLLYATRTHAWNERFMGQVDPADIMMNDAAPPEVAAAELALWFALDDELNERKVNALLCQASQVTGLVDQLGLEEFGEGVRDEFFRLPRPDEWAR
jgi:LmbE family N-acetylglucosaminyl deacetylase